MRRRVIELAAAAASCATRRRPLPPRRDHRRVRRAAREPARRARACRRVDDFDDARPVRLGFFLREALRSLRAQRRPVLRGDGHRARHGARARRLHPGRAGDDRRRQRGARPVLVDVYLKTNADAAGHRARPRALIESTPRRRQGRVRLQGAGLRARSASATPRPTSCWAPTRCPTPSASRPTSPTTSPRCATRSRRSAPAASAPSSTRRSTRSRTARTTRTRSSPPRAS